MQKIYFVRHGETNWNVLKKVQGYKNSTLTQLGIKQAKKISYRLAEKRINKIYSSDLERAIETSKIINEKMKSEIVVCKGLREMNFGVWEGLSKTELRNQFNEDLLKWTYSPEIVKFPNGESLKELYIRVGITLNQILSKNKSDFIIVSHGSAIKVMIIYLLNWPLASYKNLSLDNVSLSIIEKRDFNNVLTLYNDTTHLGE